MIREDIFKKRIIRHVFKKSGMWPINIKQCLKNLKKFNPSSKLSSILSGNDKSILSILPRTSMNVKRGLEKWNQYLESRCSSPSRPKWESFI